VLSLRPAAESTPGCHNEKGVRHRERPGRSGSGSGSDRRHLDKTHALAAVKAFADPYGAKFGKPVAKIIDDVDELLAFYD
jgi:hypothetical protein